MHTEDVRATVDTIAERGKRARQAIARGAPGERADEVLARDREQQRATQLVQALEAAQQLDRLRGRLGEVGAGVEHELLLAHARRQRQLDALGEEGEHLIDDLPVEVWVLQPFARRDAGMHQHEPSAVLGADGGQLRVAQAADVVDDPRACGDRGAGDGRLVSVYRDDRVELACDMLDQRRNQLDLLLRVNRRPTGRG